MYCIHNNKNNTNRKKNTLVAKKKQENEHEGVRERTIVDRKNPRKKYIYIYV